jgi:hypothetical protein
MCVFDALATTAEYSLAEHSLVTGRGEHPLHAARHGLLANFPIGADVFERHFQWARRLNQSCPIDRFFLNQSSASGFEKSL